MRSLLRRSLVLALLALVSDSTAIRVNVTIDDEDGDASTGWMPQYFPSSAWAQGSKCSGCAITGLADPSQAFDETWHDSTYHPEQPQRVVQINFNGSAVYVYNLVANTIPGVTTFTNLTFVLDGTEVGQYTHSPQNNAASTFLYRTVVYQNDSLPQAPHMLSIEAGGPTASLILFDYVIYTTEHDATGVPSSSLTPPSASGTQAVMPEATSTPTPSVAGSQPASAKSSSVAVGAGIGAAVGVVLALLTLVIGTLVFRKRRSLVLLLFSRKGTNVHHNTNRPSSFDGAEDTWPRSSPVSSSYLSPLYPPSPIVSSLYPTIETSSSFRSSDLVFAPIPTPSPRNSASRIPTPLATPPDHRADVPAPAISATGTEHSVRLADLTREIAELEQLMHGIHKGEGKRKPRGPRGGPGHGVDISFEALQERVARLREELEAERRLLIEALPREKRHDPWSLKGRKLRVVNPEESSNA
ncbi:hypothetical protein K466DRAFT_585124 [Polyporus arcularius HHB13444]|uniref:Uncharacterized protein n=1 Tax=Polyporus arcularius HHB13444 TaxID=1314778 RepID=A0A5C3PGK2_9APHY|nr:hypothetical protein K466DRAFT_585124 [Polyporus arcularius HHB13444]